MIVSFNTEELRDGCASLEKAEAAVGLAHAQELLAVLSDAEANETAAEFIELYAPSVIVDKDTISLPVGTQYRLSFVAIGAALIRDGESEFDWGKVRRLKVMDFSRC